MLRIKEKPGSVFTGVALIAWLLQSCNGGSTHSHNKKIEQPDSILTHRQKMDTIKLWTELRLIKWKSWIDSNTRFIFSTDSMYYTGTAQLRFPTTHTIMSDKQFNEFDSFFIYSPDSSYVLDMISYRKSTGNDTDGKEQRAGKGTEVALVNVQTKERQLILSTSPATIIKQEVWIDDSTLFIGGGTYDHQRKLMPDLWRYNVKQQTLSHWTYH
ncbi:hypothetical protein KTO58_23965 [Chitinophaga pendula]|uniref:hypothetical protein n=1 Tax=Chitinophaga TaxID=79328 RepID=UPI000BAED761|nr:MULTISPECIES: hypothetical protein [Chitinophaga]ASZ10347.1 hypothetical protein CK934_04795 [Chitinophaga sp. MD30]UCJ06690.1 hypothetical protein KTO58_23965 [Chitinophaga pendula]